MQFALAFSDATRCLPKFSLHSSPMFVVFDRLLGTGDCVAHTDIPSMVGEDAAMEIECAKGREMEKSNQP